MSSGSYEQNSLDWQIYLFQQRFGEWLERLLSPLGGATPPNWSVSDDLLRFLFWLIAIALASWLVWVLLRLLRSYFDRFLPPASRTVATRASDSEQIFSRAEWLQRSRSYAQQGHYGEACRCLYFAALQQLDDRKLIPQQPSRTDGEYLRLVQPLSHSRPYQLLIRTHEQFCFSETEVSAVQFDRCQQAYREIEAEADPQERTR